jgi:hypothetical protein
MEETDWTKRIPWWVAWLFVGGFGLAGAFGSAVLPMNWQLVGFLAGCTSMFAAGTGTALHFINEYREAHNQRRVRMEPLHLIVIGLLIIAGGVGWQWIKDDYVRSNPGIHPSFAGAYEHHSDKLGKPKGLAINTPAMSGIGQLLGAYQGAFDKGTVLWTYQSQTIFV